MRIAYRDPRGKVPSIVPRTKICLPIQNAGLKVDGQHLVRRPHDTGQLLPKDPSET